MPTSLPNNNANGMETPQNRCLSVDTILRSEMGEGKQRLVQHYGHC